MAEWGTVRTKALVTRQHVAAASYVRHTDTVKQFGTVRTMPKGSAPRSPILVWTGTEWAARPILRYNGTEWVPE